jgi:hypothetical protein
LILFVAYGSAPSPNLFNAVMKETVNKVKGRTKIRYENISICKGCVDWQER